MTVVYLDSLFLLNLGLDGVLLAAAQKLGGVERAYGRTLLAAACGALYTAMVFCVRQPYAAHPVTRIAVAAGMVLLAVGGKKRAARVLILFFLLSCSLAGGVLLLEVAGVGRLATGQGVPATASDGKLLLLCGAGEYLLVSLLIHLPGKAAEEIVTVLLTCEGRAVLLRVLVDSGNKLCDPLTGNPVLIAELDAVRGLFPRECRPKRSELAHPEDHLAELAVQWEPARLRIIPYRAVGTEQGLLLAVRVDEMEVKGTRRKNQLVAVTPGQFSQGYQGLIWRQD